MKAIIKTVLVFAVALVSLSVQAQYNGPKATMSCGDFRSTNCDDVFAQVYDDDGYPLKGLRVGDMRSGRNTRAGRHLSEQVVIRTERTSVGNTVVCGEDNILKKLFGAILGGVIGHQIGDGRGQDVATAAGAVIGASIAGSSGNCRAIIREGGSKEGRTSGGERRMIRNSNCEIGGESYAGLSESDCLKLSDRLFSKPATQSVRRGGNNEQTLKTYGGEETATKNEQGFTCFLKNRDEQIIADFHDASKNPKGIVVTSGSACREAKQNFRG